LLMASAKVSLYKPYDITREYGGGLVRHPLQISAYSEDKGNAQTLHDGPSYLFIFDQQSKQNGASL